MDKSAIATVLSVIGILWGVYVFYRGQQRIKGEDWQVKIEKAVEPFMSLPKRVADLEAELGIAKKQLEVFWRGVSFSSAAALHSPHTKELDGLLEAFQRDEIKGEKDLQKLKGMLKEVADYDPNPMRKKYAMDILTLIHVRFEIGGDLVTLFREQTQTDRLVNPPEKE